MISLLGLHAFRLRILPSSIPATEYCKIIHKYRFNIPLFFPAFKPMTLALIIHISYNHYKLIFHLFTNNC